MGINIKKYSFNYKYFIVLILFVIYSSSYSQNSTFKNYKLEINKNNELLNKAKSISNIDSSLLIYNQIIKSINNSNDSVYVKAIFEKGLLYFKSGEYDSAFFYLNEATKLGLISGQQNIEVRSLNYIGLLFNKKGNYNKSISNLISSNQKAKSYNLKTEEAKSINNLGLIYRDLGIYDKSITCLNKAYYIFQELKDTISLMSTMNNLGLVNKDIKDYTKAIYFYNKTLNIANNRNNIFHQSRIYSNLGVLYYKKGEYKKALEYNYKALELNKEINNNYKISINYSNIAKIHLKKNQYSKAIEFYKKAIKYLGENGSFKENISYSNQLATAYIYNKQYSLAYKRIMFALDLLKSTPLPNYKLFVETNKILSLYYEKTNNYKKALHFHIVYDKYKDSLSNNILNNEIAKQKVNFDFSFQKSELEKLNTEKTLNEIITEKHLQKIKNDRYIFIGIMIILLIGIISFLIVQMQLRENKKANTLLLKNRKKLLKKNYEITLQNNEIKSQTEQLYGINDDLMQLKTAIDETDNAVVILDKNGKFEWGNKGFDKLYDINFNDFIKKYPNILDASVKSSNYKMMSTIIKRCINEKTSGSYEFATFNRDGKKIWIQTNIKAVTDISGNIQNLIVIDTDISDKVETGRLLEQKNYKLEKQKEEIDASLRYAQTIQEAILPAPFSMRKNNDFFLIYKPKDIVSGDFYWFSDQKNSPYIFFAIVDCTGHGVPGAFMSLIGARLLNFIVNEKNIYDPAEILEQMHISVNIALKQKLSGNRDGMDISLCRIIKTKKEEKEVIFSGAKQSIYYSNNNKLTKIRGDVKTIGGHYHDNVDFTNKRFTLKSDDMIYMLTDGYIDQDSIDGKKIGSQNVYKILDKISNFPIKQQKLTLTKYLDSHKNGANQRDDITFLGIKIV